MPLCETKKGQKQMGNSQSHVQSYPPDKMKGMDAQDESSNVQDLILAINKCINITLETSSGFSSVA